MIAPRLARFSLARALRMAAATALATMALLTLLNVVEHAAHAFGLAVALLGIGGAQAATAVALASGRGRLAPIVGALTIPVALALVLSAPPHAQHGRPDPRDTARTASPVEYLQDHAEHLTPRP